MRPDVIQKLIASYPHDEMDVLHAKRYDLNRDAINDENQNEYYYIDAPKQAGGAYAIKLIRVYIQPTQNSDGYVTLKSGENFTTIRKTAADAFLVSSFVVGRNDDIFFTRRDKKFSEIAHLFTGEMVDESALISFINKISNFKI